MDHLVQFCTSCQSYRRFENLHLDADILSHNLSEVISRRAQNFQPAVFPVANTREPRRTATARKTLRTASGNMHPAIPIEHVALPDLLDRDVISIGKVL
jgi:hypothetical protein